MIGLDTNVLVRYLTRDDDEQYRLADELITDAVNRGEELHIDTIVLVELVWVLRTAYRIDRPSLARLLRSILDTRQFAIEDRPLLRKACDAFEEGPGDFSDYLIGLRSHHAGCMHTATFDKALGGAQELFLVL